MRFMLLLLLPGCSLLTDFDRELTVLLEITGNIPEPKFTTTLNQIRDQCVSACTLARTCFYDPEFTSDCAHAAEGTSHKASNDAVLLHACVGVCVASTDLLSTGPRRLETCEDLQEKVVLKAAIEPIFCTNDLSLCGTLFCAPAGDRTILETCIDIDLFGTCRPNCERLPEAYWTCAIEDYFFQSVKWAQDNPGATEQDKDDQDGRFLCAALKRCAGSGPQSTNGG